MKSVFLVCICVCIYVEMESVNFAVSGRLEKTLYFLFCRRLTLAFLHFFLLVNVTNTPSVVQTKNLDFLTNCSSSPVLNQLPHPLHFTFWEVLPLYSLFSISAPLVQVQSSHSWITEIDLWLFPFHHCSPLNNRRDIFIFPIWLFHLCWKSFNCFPTIFYWIIIDLECCVSAFPLQ